MAGINDAADYQGRFVWYELSARDVDAVRAFYSKVMGWGVQDASMPGFHYTFFTVRNSFVSGLMGLPQTDRPSGWLGYVAVDDVDATVDAVARLGGTVHAPPTDVFGATRFAIVADPQAAPFAILTWQRPRADPLGDHREAGRVGWHELFAGDSDAAFAFYAELFGWRQPEDGPGDRPPQAHAHDQDQDASGHAYRRFAVAGDTIGGMFRKPPALPVSLWLYYFNVPDITTAARRVTAAGGQVLEGPLEIPPGDLYILRCSDPEGTAFALRGPRRRGVGYFPPAPPRR